MATAYSCLGERTAPVFDTADTLLIVPDSGAPTCVKLHEFNAAEEVIRVIQEMQADTLICGAISNGYMRRILSSGIRVISFVSGNINSIIDDYESGRDIKTIYAMPGCRCRLNNVFPRRKRHARFR